MYAGWIHHGFTIRAGEGEDHTCTKSSRLEEVDVPQNLDLLNKWTIPKGSDDDYESDSGSVLNCLIYLIVIKIVVALALPAKEVTDSKFREKIINLATSNESNSSSSKPFENKKNDLNDFEYSAPYSSKEVDDRLIKRNVFS
uniref:Uncharacterized protein n=1 Tax=Solanum tuberosum TaxID=4113 RepID=M1DHT1_SOLTU